MRCEARELYVVYASMEEAAVSRLPGERMLVKDREGEFTMAVSSSQTAPPGKRAVTFTCRTEVDSWFAYQSSEEDYEQWDQEALEQFWNRLHAALAGARQRHRDHRNRKPAHLLRPDTPQTRYGFRC